MGEYVKQELSVGLGLDLHIGTSGEDGILKRLARVTLWNGLYCLLASLAPGFLSRRSVLGPGEMAGRILHYAVSPTRFPWRVEGSSEGSELLISCKFLDFAPFSKNQTHREGCSSQVFSLSC